MPGLRNCLTKKGVHVVTVLTAFVATKMTDSMDLPAKLSEQSDEIADATFCAVQKKQY